MNYELNDYLIQLHQHIVNEQLQIRTLVKMLAGEGVQELPLEKVMNLREVRENVEKRASSAPNWLLVGEKESRFNIFLKLNQQLQKWIELELNLLKEIAKLQIIEKQNSPANTEISGELQPEDINIL